MESIPFATLRTAMSEESGFRLHRLWKERYVASSLPLVALHPRWPQSMILVGNGPSARGKGVLIDSFECVVRFNLFTTAGHDVGSRMTDWCVSDHVAVHRTPRPWSNASANLFCIVGNSPYAHTDAAIRSRVPKRTVCVRPIVPVESDHWLSTGMLALHYFLRARPTAALFVVGFDHFSGEYHYDTPIAPHAIPHTQDHAFFQRLQREFPHRIVRV